MGINGKELKYKEQTIMFIDGFDVSAELRSDGNEYEKVVDAVKCVHENNVPGMICEIGTYRGGGLYLIMKTFLELNDLTRVFVGVDPYGDILYYDVHGAKRGSDYTNTTRNKFLSVMYSWCYKMNIDFLFFNLEDREFFKRYSDGIPVYRTEKKLLTKYALVVIDGPHTLHFVKLEFDFFKDRMSPGGIIVFDDTEQYSHNDMEHYIASCGFSVFGIPGTYKKAYIYNGKN